MLSVAARHGTLRHGTAWCVDVPLVPLNFPLFVLMTFDALNGQILSGAEDADVNYPCFHGGETPLMAACTKGHLQ